MNVCISLNIFIQIRITTYKHAVHYNNVGRDSEKSPVAYTNLSPKCMHSGSCASYLSVFIY